MTLSAETINEYFESNYQEMEAYKKRFGSFNQSDVEDAFQAAYYDMVINADNIPVNDSADETIKRYFYTAMANKLKAYRNKGIRSNFTDFQQQVSEEDSTPTILAVDDTDQYAQIDAKITLDLIKDKLSPEEFELIYELYGEGRPAYAIADERGTTKYLINAEANLILNKVQKYFG